MLKLFVILLLLGLYLNRSYAYFYNYLGERNLRPPAHPAKILLGNHPSNTTTRYAALGDSLTEGVGASDYEHSYPYLVAQKMAEKNNVELINFARAGAVSQDVIDNQLPQVLQTKHDFITILIGVNDIHNKVPVKTFEKNLTTIVKACKESGAKVYVLSVPYLGSNKVVYFPYDFLLNYETEQFNNTVKKVAAEYGVRFIDLKFSIMPANFYASDQFHPSDLGYREWFLKFNND